MVVSISQEHQLLLASVFVDKCTGQIALIRLTQSRVGHDDRHGLVCIRLLVCVLFLYALAKAAL